ncbi:MAG: hypothetical protein CEE38_04450 [Planctomycetes bacterium B3_Pla]|nr:MAG: hypothetical protein CEE38_04450 [Planctomycetes bacterium B3_Pla]
MMDKKQITRERMDRTLECALYYISQGWPVLPLHTIKGGHCTCPRKKPCKPGKHPYSPLVPNGSKDATTDEETILKWFGGDYDVNIGILAGKESGLVLLDIDPEHGGNESLKKYPKLLLTPSVKTGGGGRGAVEKGEIASSLRSSQ